MQKRKTDKVTLTKTKVSNKKAVNKKTTVSKLNKKESGKESKNSKNNSMLRVVLFSLLFLFIIFIVLLSIAYFSYAAGPKYSDIVSVTVVNATINVSDYIGFNMDKDKLHFGTVFPGGGYSLRDITLSSKQEGYVYITVEPEFQKWIFVSAQNEHINKDQILPLKFVAKPPAGVSSGDYEFKIKVYILKRKAGFMTGLFLGKGAFTEKNVNDFNSGSAQVGITIVNRSAINSSLTQ